MADEEEESSDTSISVTYADSTQTLEKANTAQLHVHGKLFLTASDVNDKFSAPEIFENSHALESLENSSATEIHQNSIATEIHENSIATEINENLIATEIHENSIATDINENPIATEIHENSIATDINGNSNTLEVKENSNTLEINENSITLEIHENSHITERHETSNSIEVPENSIENTEFVIDEEINQNNSECNSTSRMQSCPSCDYIHHNKSNYSNPIPKSNKENFHKLDVSDERSGQEMKVVIDRRDIPSSSSSSRRGLPSYKSLGEQILQDEPPRYEDVTGIKLCTELVSEKSIFSCYTLNSVF